jgi:hypothetical protein
MRRLALAALTALLVAVPVWANIGRVKTLTGTSRIERAGQKLMPTPGFVMEKGDLIVTPAKSMIGITFVDNARIAIGPNSRVLIRAFEFNDTTNHGTFVAEVQKGQVAVFGGLISKSDGKAMQIRTPKSVFAVRGSRIVVTVK